MPGKPPFPAAVSREVVLAWADVNGKGYAAAADHFRLNRETVKSWFKRRAKAAPTVAPTPPRRGSENADGSVINRGEGDKPAAPPSSPRARETERLARLGDATKANIRSGVRGLGKFIASTNDDRPLKSDEEDAGIDYRQVEAAARALKVLLEIAPGIDAFDEQTGTGNTQRGPTAEDVARLDHAMLDPLPVRPGPRLVERQS